ncbi:gamma-glutamylcyclotransferase [Acidianus sp. RZ1]|uniref:gamma-glutamylcyclotransferase n=1 Tax=Acidianus sp. RZ1 TaxID=1540082 RepID=UPI0014928EC5|nr:gamma-glutamylcyclotransferase [Acidianus sp. RZ1]NON61172.1 gamma-glutamylcyclotransferase [Acidianus sp. RZ1]
MYIFVYGSLRYGYELHHLLKDKRLVGLGFIEGYKMLDLGNYPGIVRGDGIVWGEVYDIDEQLLMLLDEVEDYRGKPDDLYVREKTTVFFDQKRRFYLDNVYMYKYNQYNAGFKEIESGDYSRWSGMPVLTNYFAYAENTNLEILKERGVKNILAQLKGYLDGYRLIFNVKCKYGYCANLKEEHEAKVCGYIYVVLEDELSVLDKAEEHLVKYIRDIVKVKDEEGKVYFASTYVYDIKDKNMKPSEEYLKIIREGLGRLWGRDCISTGL